ncbi:MAG: TAXI family TRAP transporter solute-binding subunit [bacterium]|nr:TAXI family TRAP transporter solute-binding subunit [bacterium]
MKLTKIMFVAVLAVAIISIGFADAQVLTKLRMASGGEGGTYYVMANNMATYCGEGLALDVQATGGSDDNVERLINNKADVAIVQKDILFKRAKFNNDAAVKNFLAVMPLHYEAMHVVVLEKSGIVKFSDLGAMKGRFYGGSPGKKVGAYGGSIESAEIVKAMSDVAYEIVVVENQKAAVAALNSGQIDAILAMGGTPLKWVGEELKRGQHRLVQFDVPIDKVAGAYRKANVTYTRLGANAVPTISTDAVLITRNFTTAEKVRAVSLLRKCVWSELTRMQEADDTHGQWQNVQKDTQVEGWSWFAGMQVQWPSGGGSAPVPKRK